MGFAGSSISTPNSRIRFFLITFVGIIAFASILYWRQQTLVSADYVEFPTHQTKSKKGSELRSKNFQIDTEDVSPSVK